MCLRLYGEEFVVPVVVRDERSTVDAAGIEADGMFSLHRVVMNSVAEEDAIGPLVIIIPKRVVVASSMVANRLLTNS